MRRRELLVALACAALRPGMAPAQQSGRRYRVGSVYMADPATTRSYEAAFFDKLAEFGYGLGRNLVYDVRYCNGDPSKLPGFVEEVLALRPDLLTGIEQVAQAMRRATTTVPIVLTSSNDPVAAGLVASLARPGGNVTGVAGLTELMAAKQLEMMAEILPRLTSVAVLLDPTTGATPTIERHVRQMARALRVRVDAYYVSNRSDLDRAFDRMAQIRPDCLISSSGSGTIFGHLKLIAERTLNLKLPGAGVTVTHAEAGFVISYGPNLHERFRRAAAYAARILGGARPADLPIDQAEAFNIVINLRAAQNLGLSIPQRVLLRADRVIE